MSESDGSGTAGLSLVEFLEYLRSDLLKARASAVQAAMDAQAAGGSPLMFGLEEVEVTLEVAHTTTSTVTGKAEAEAKFWVFASAKAGGEASRGWARSGTQTLTLKLSPSFLEPVDDGTGKQTLQRRKPEISGEADPGEIPPPRNP